MRSAPWALVAALVLTMAALAGCGGGGGGGGNPASTSYMPLAVGNTWDYILTLAPGLEPAQISGGTRFPYHETVTGVATLQGTRYFAIQARREAVDPYPEGVWQQFRREDREAIYSHVSLIDPDTGAVVVAYDRPFLKLPPVKDATWTDPYFPDVTYTIVAVAAPVNVPAGQFTCVRVDEEYDYQPEDPEDPPIHVVWRSFYARGIGLVRDESLEDGRVISTLELVSYSLQ